MWNRRAVTRVRTGAEADILMRARRVHAEAIVGDIHTHVLLSVGYLGFDVTRERIRFKPGTLRHNLSDLVTVESALEGGVDLLVFVVYVFPWPWRGYRRSVRRMIGRFEQLLERYADRCGRARSVADVRRLKREGKLACMLALEGAHAIERDISELFYLREQGVTYLTLTHFLNNDVSGSATHPGCERGITPLGREVIHVCNQLGILVDITHSSERAKLEAAELSDQPVICSHTGLQRRSRVRRLTDADELRLIRDKRGLVGLMVSPFYVRGTLHDGGVADLVHSLAYAVDIAGEDCVCIGSDLNSGLPPLRDVRSIADYGRITCEMLRQGFGEALVKKIWAENFLDLLARVGWSAPTPASRSPAAAGQPRR